VAVQTALDVSRYACGWARIDATPAAQGLLPPSGLKIVGGCNALREPLLLAMRRVETYGDTNKRRCRYPGDAAPLPPPYAICG
jgi:hypothetical protein